MVVRVLDQGEPVHVSGQGGAAGGKLVPEVAKGFTVSKNGRTYTFHLKSGYRFSDGAKVTAKSFAYAIKRATNKTLNSPAGPFITDKSAVNIGVSRPAA